VKGVVGGSLPWHGHDGEALTKHQGAPLRLLVSRWYGVANVKCCRKSTLRKISILASIRRLVPHDPGRDD